MFTNDFSSSYFHWMPTVLSLTFSLPLMRNFWLALWAYLYFLWSTIQHLRCQGSRWWNFKSWLVSFIQFCSYFFYYASGLYHEYLRMTFNFLTISFFVFYCLVFPLFLPLALVFPLRSKYFPSPAGIRLCVHTFCRGWRLTDDSTSRMFRDRVGILANRTWILPGTPWTKSAAKSMTNSGFSTCLT